LKPVKVTVDGRIIDAPEGAPLLQAMLDAGLDVPHYCYHPKLSIDGSCRLCQVKIEGVPKLQIACNTPVKDGMVVHAADEDVALARRGAIELLLVNHPLDCPICDKAGECWLQNYAMRYGSRHGRTVDARRKHGKRLDIGERMLLDQERCILCRRCVRFCREITGTGELAVFNNGDHSVLDIYDQRLDNDYSMNTADICPVGALETKDFHHRIRVWFLEETASVCAGCSNGCNIFISHHKDRIWRLIPRRNDAVNDTWICDAGRLNYGFVGAPERIRVPYLGGDAGLAPATWDEAVDAAATALSGFVARAGAAALGAVVSPHLTNEEHFQFGALLDALGGGRRAMAIVRGNADNLLIKAEKAANARGARELGLVTGADDGIEGLISGIEAGEIKGLYLCGTDLFEVVPAQRLNAAIAKLELLIFQGLRIPEAAARATVVFPTTAFAEKAGTFTNHAGRVQRILPAVGTPAGWLADGEIFTRLLNTIALRGENFTLEGVWNAMGRTQSSFGGMRLGEIGPHGAALNAPGK
jgi:NADH-quinone oxidoreductase subunit G